MLSTYIINGLARVKCQLTVLSSSLTPMLSQGFSPALCGLDGLGSSSQTPSNAAVGSLFDDALWFAVPKSKISRSKKRLKTNWQKKPKKIKHITTCRFTGLTTLKHRLPKGWEEFLGEGGVVRSPLEVLVAQGVVPKSYKHWEHVDYK